MAQAPTRRIPAQAEEEARTALQHVRRSHTTEAGVAAIVGLQWLLNRVEDDPHAAADWWYALGVAYSLLPGGDLQAKLERALRCFQEVLQVHTQQESPTAWALVQQRLAEVYGRLPRGERQANQEAAIACCTAALTVFTREASPVEWAAIQVTLGEIYRERVKEERRANLEYAIACCEAAFEVYTSEAFPVEWAATNVRLGDAYQARIEGARQENRERALAYYDRALSIYTRGAFPVEWAATQASKGDAYRVRIAGERQDNLNVAIACCRAALEVYTPEALPVEWASTHLSLGRAYQEQAVEEGLWEGLQAALACYDRALSVFTQGAFPVAWAAAQRWKGDAFRRLREGDRHANLECALACYDGALSIYTQDAFPGAYRDVQLERAEIEAERGNWLQAHVAYAGACEAEELLLRLGSGTMGHDRIVLEGREAALCNGYALAQLGRFAEASIAMEGGQAHWMAEAQLLSPASIERISNQERRERYNSVRQRLIAAQADLDRVPLPDASEREQRRALLERIAALRKAQAAFDTVIAEIRAAHDPADFLDDVLDAEVVLRAAARGGAGHALVYLAATPWGGVAVAVLHADSALGTAGRFAALSLPHLTTSLLEDLVETTLNDDGRPVIGGYLHAQYSKALALLEHDWGGQTFRESATALHAACVAACKGSTFDLAAQQLLEASALASSLDTPFAALDPQQSSVLANTFGHVFLQHELERCLRALSSTALTPLMAWLRGEGAGSLTLIPCAKLAIFPLTSVLLPDGRTVGETLPASMAPSARALLPYGRGGLTRSWVYALGDPRPTQQELLWAMSEAISVARLAQQEGMHASVKVGRKATRRYVMEALQRAAVASLCCHGQFDAGNPSQSGVQLAEGEWLRREDLLNQKIDLRGLRLLTLSACQTGLIDARGAASEGRGLAADFLQAGADAVVASLWVVDDAATYLLMVRFMQEWFSCRCSEPPAQALACAQHWLRTVTNAELQEWRASSPLLSWPTQVEEPFAEEGGSLVGGAARRIAVRGRGYRLDADAAEKLIRLKATRSDLSAVPYADPYFWAGFQVMGW